MSVTVGAALKKIAVALLSDKKTLKKAAKLADNNSLSPTFLMQAGEILESQKKNKEALELYLQIKNNYYESLPYQDIDKYIERVSK